MKRNTHVTIINEYKNRKTNKVEYHKTYLYNVYLEERKGAVSERVSANNADGMFLMIPFAVYAGGKTFLPPKAFAEKPPPDVLNYWTLQGTKTRVIKGIVDKDISDFLDADKYDYSYTVTIADIFDVGFKHWEVKGK